MNENKDRRSGGDNAPGDRPLTYRQKLLMGYIDPDGGAQPLPPRAPNAPLPPVPPRRPTKARRMPDGIKPDKPDKRGKSGSSKTYKASSKKASRAEAGKIRAAKKKLGVRAKIGIAAAAVALIAAVAAVIAMTAHKTIQLIKDEGSMKLRPLPYKDVVFRYSDEYDVPPDVIYAVMRVESSFRPDAVSGAGAIGLMQLIMPTFEWLQTKTGDTYGEEALYNPEINIKYGTYLLGWLYGRYGSWNTAWAAYNAGIGRVNGWLEDARYSKDGELYDIPIEETRHYVRRVAEEREEYLRLYFGEDAVAAYTMKK
ncbi:MAG: lytic transglycosylase domain-containing protein [Clostridiales bacterium]|nr:lytic transglycosylase domain-containing protein [Clostridiales bacterium]